MTEGMKMWFSVMGIFLIYAIFFIVFDDFDRKNSEPLIEYNDWHLILGASVAMVALGFLLYRYAKRMDERISRKQAAKETRMRRELTQNIAHELKTPVTSILGFTDTILENPDISDKTKHQFIERTNIQARRLTSLLQDLSTLNKMDYAPDMLVTERVDVSLLVTDIVMETSIMLQQKQMTLKNCLQQSICVEGNWSLLYSIFRNLITNAINYAGNGATIVVSAKSKGNEWFFTVSDNGVGVPSEHLPRLFERFYRVDKGRSRSLGGTGLGLAIVKNSVQWHGGTIRVSNNPTGGLRFDFNLPQYIVKSSDDPT